MTTRKKTPELHNMKFAELVPNDAVYIGRPSKWGNPFIVGRDGDRKTCIEKYRVWLDEHIAQGLLNIDELRGRDLACWCAPEPCHGDVLLELANAPMAK